MIAKILIASITLPFILGATNIQANENINEEIKKYNEQIIKNLSEQCEKYSEYDVAHIPADPLHMSLHQYLVKKYKLPLLMTFISDNEKKVFKNFIKAKENIINSDLNNQIKKKLINKINNLEKKYIYNNRYLVWRYNLKLKYEEKLKKSESQLMYELKKWLIKIPNQELEKLIINHEKLVMEALKAQNINMKEEK